MVVQKEDYRTNRADYLIATMRSRATTDDDRNQIVAARKKMPLLLRDRRLARLAANPCESLPRPRTRPRGWLV